MQTLDGIWDFGFSDEITETPVFDSAVTIPLCTDTSDAYKGRRGTAFFRRLVRTGGPVRLAVTAGLHSRIYWDGRKIGESVLPWTREFYRFNAGDLRSHVLMIAADNLTDDSPSSMFRPFYDFYGYCGIYDNVELEELYPGFPETVRVIPLNPETGEIQLRLRCFQGPPERLTISFDNGPSAEYPYSDQLILNVPDCRPWTPDHPHLHQLTVNGRTVTFGMRILDWQGQTLKLNGQPLKLIGVCRHESHPEFGPATPPSLIWNDLMMLRKQGCNFIRGSHYPQKEIMLDFADRLGLLVWDEALGWGNKPEQLADPVFMERQEEQCRKMIGKSFNHPSVIIWGFLNECASDSPEGVSLVRRLTRVIHEEDPSRPVTFASNRWQKDLCLNLVDIISLNVYPDWYDENDDPENLHHTHELLREIAEYFPEKPLIISEIGCAALFGDHSGYRWSEEFQAEHMKAVLEEILFLERYTGVSLWQFCDTRSYNSTRYCISRPRGFNNKGLLDEYRRPKLAWKTLKTVLSNRQQEKTALHPQ